MFEADIQRGTTPLSPSHREMLLIPGGTFRMGSDSHYPEEVVGELRVLAVRPHSCTAMVTRSTREIELNDAAVARKGY